MIKQIDCIEGQPIRYDDVAQTLSFMGRGRIDDDGYGSAHKDPDHQNDTTLHLNGRALNADVDFYIVIPEQVPNEVPPIVLGSLVEVTYNGVTVLAVVGDTGPKKRLGEMSIALAKALGINADPNIGGDDYPTVSYLIHMGVPALVNGIQYALQPA